MMALPAIVGTLLIPILMQILKLMTPAIREELVKFIQGWVAHAFATPNKWDDVAAKLVAAMLSVDISGVVAPPTNEVTTELVSSIITIATGNPLGWTANRPFDPAVDQGG
jgi:hypothetical protein